MRFSSLLVCLLVLASGCATKSSDATPDVEGGVEATADAQTLTPPGATVFSETFHFEGTFSLQDSGQINRLAGQNAAGQAHALDVPTGQPLVVTIHAEAATAGDIDTFLDGDMEIWRADCDCPLGPVNERSYHMRANGPVDFVIQYDEHGHEASFDYAADITVEARNDTFLAGVPVGITLAVGEGVQAGGAQVLVHGPDDERIGTLGRGFVAPEAGEYILFPLENIRLESNATQPNPRLLPLVNDATGVMPVGTDFHHEFNAPANSLYIGYCVIAGEATVDPEVELTGPDGVLSTSSASGPQLAGDWGDCTEIGTAGLDAYVGAYNLRVTTTASEGAEASRWVTMWQR